MVWARSGSDRLRARFGKGVEFFVVFVGGLVEVCARRSRIT